MTPEELEKYVAAAVGKERDACAKIAEEMIEIYNSEINIVSAGGSLAAAGIAQAIRARN